MHAKYTGLNTNIELLPHTIKTALTPALGASPKSHVYSPE